MYSCFVFYCAFFLSFLYPAKKTWNNEANDAFFWYKIYSKMDKRSFCNPSVGTFPYVWWILSEMKTLNSTPSKLLIIFNKIKKNLTETCICLTEIKSPKSNWARKYLCKSSTMLFLGKTFLNFLNSFQGILKQGTQRWQYFPHFEYKFYNPSCI